MKQTNKQCAVVFGAEKATERFEEEEPQPRASATSMATASTSGLGKKKKNPGLMDSFSKIFGGDKKKRSKVGSNAFKRGGLFFPPRCHLNWDLNGG